jgi:hypothetical protein
MVLLAWAGGTGSAASTPESPSSFPHPLSSYPPPENNSLGQILWSRVEADPFNLVATGLFFLAILHTFLAPMFLRLAHRFEREHAEKLARLSQNPNEAAGRREVSFRAEVFHFFGEVEAVFGIWVLPLLAAITLFEGWPAARDYLGHGLNFTEPMFVVVIMTIAASRPILLLAEKLMAVVARLGRGTPAAWWLSILTLGPILGSLITEPAAMTISALLLARKFYDCQPSRMLSYATLGLLFVNVSVGGTLTHFAAPPVLMVSSKWNWDSLFMFQHFGCKALAGIVVANALYFICFHREFNALAARVSAADGDSGAASRSLPLSVPAWVTSVHLLFLGWTVLNNHFPALFIGGFLFYLAFTRATEPYQNELALRPALLVGFFLAGLVIHGGLQAWWIAPVLGGLSDRLLFFGAATLTAFNDNAAITYLSSLVPTFSPEMKYAVVAGAVAGGGLTVIANAPNPAGQSILARYFPEGVSPLGLFLGALAPTVILSAAFLLLR